MSKALTTNIASIVIALALVLGFAFAFATPAQAQTVEELQATIDSLIAQIDALTGTTPSVTGAGCFTFTMTLKQGSTGAEAMNVQKFLNAHGFMVAAAGAGSPGNETSNFGSLTRAAVIKYQNAYAANILTPLGLTMGTGVWGPASIAQAHALCASTGTGTGTGTSTGTSTGTTPPPPPDDMTLEGGAGSVESFTAISGLSNEKVGEGEEDIEIAGLEVEADDSSDLMLTAVRLDFSTQPGNNDLEDFVTDVSIWLDGKEIARLD